MEIEINIKKILSKLGYKDVAILVHTNTTVVFTEDERVPVFKRDYVEPSSWYIGQRKSIEQMAASM